MSQVNLLAIDLPQGIDQAGESASGEGDGASAALFADLVGEELKKESVPENPSGNHSQADEENSGNELSAKARKNHSTSESEQKVDAASADTSDEPKPKRCQRTR